MRYAPALLVAFAALSACAAPVRVNVYTAPGIVEEPIAECAMYPDVVRVLGAMPAPGTFEELGYMDLEQSGGGVLSTDSAEQIKQARIRACQMGAEAIVVVDRQAQKGTTWSMWTGTKGVDEMSTRIVAIRLTKPPAIKLPDGPLP